MSKSSISSLNFTEKEDYWKSNFNYSFCQVYETQLPKQGIFHPAHPACEYQEHSYQQHGIAVHLKLEGNSLQRIEDRMEVTNANVNDIAIIPAKMDFWRRTEIEVCEGILLVVEPQTISRITCENVEPERVELLSSFANHDPLIQHLALNIKANLDSSSYDRLYAESLFQALATHLFKNYSTRKLESKEFSGLPPYKLRQAIEYINDNLDRPIKVKDIAKLIDISQYYFCRLFHDSTGVSPYQYVIQKRIAKAKNLIENSKRSLADISYECGFSSQSQMTQHFRKIVGVTPRVYRHKL